VKPDVAKTRLQQAEQTGLIKREPRTTDKFRFFHLNLQDYFGARGLTNLSLIDPTDVAWRQVILFRAGMSESDGDAIAALIKQTRTVLTSKADPNRKSKEAYVEQLQMEVESIRSAVKHTGTAR
jgi:hypothetical protein